MLAVPLITTAVILLTLISQMSILLAFFLPLKVMILLGVNDLPNSLPTIMRSLDRDLLIIYMSGGAIFFYIVHIIANKLGKTLVQRGASKLVLQNVNFVQFAKTYALGLRIYKRQVQIMADTVFILLAWFGQIVIYPKVGLAVIAFTALMVSCFVLICSSSQTNVSWLDSLLNKWVNPMGGLGFMLVFGFIVVDHLYFDPPDLVFAIITLLLTRQLFKRLPDLIISLVHQHKLANKKT
jgi:hypothetical protein